MTWVATAVVGGAVIGAVGSNMAANKQSDAQNQATQTQLGMFNTITGQEKPFLQGGYNAEQALLYGEGVGDPNAKGPQGMTFGGLNKPFNPTQDQMNNYPGYQFALNQGDQAVRNADTPNVGALSGAALKDLSSFNVGTANQFYNQYFNQYQSQQNSIFNRLSSVATMGQNAAANLGSAGTTLGTGMAQSQANAGAVRAGGTLGATNSIGNGITSAAGYYKANDGSENTPSQAFIPG